jgi:hypothetical protein
MHAQGAGNHLLALPLLWRLAGLALLWQQRRLPLL